MKKINLLAPILVMTGIGSMIAPVLTSCGQNKDIQLDSKTSKEQSTNENITSVTYAFDVNNYSESEDEIEAKIEDTSTQDQVSVEITNTYYNAENKKLYVIVTISKENGALNDQEKVQFSLSFKCHKKGQTAYKWAKKIEKFLVKHAIEGLGHFDETDLNKATYTQEKKQMQINMDLPISAAELWTEDGANDSYNINKLHVYATQGPISRLSSITINEGVTAKLNGTEQGSQSLSLTVNADTTNAQLGSRTSYNLYFAYENEEGYQLPFQVIGGFRLIFGQEPEKEYATLFGSKERHVYLEQNSKSTITETSSNLISFILDGSTYSASDFVVTSNNQNITIGDLSIHNIDAETPFTILSVAYKMEKRQHRFDYGETNVNINVKYQPKEGEGWEQTFRGLSFSSTYRSEAYNKPILKCNQDNVPTSFKATEVTTVNDMLVTVSPFELSDVILSTAKFNDGTTDYKIPFEVTQLGFDILEEKSYSETKLDPTSIEGLAGKSGKITYMILIKTLTASYYYELTSDVSFTA